jgi:hypothetical protein
MKAGRLVCALLLFVNVAVAQQPDTTIASNTTSTAGPTNKSSGESQPNAAQATEEFWPVTLKEWIELVQGVSVIVASIAAFFGIKAWHEEFIGRRRLELAEEALALFYQANDVIAFMRFPAGYTDERSSRKFEEVETPKQKQIRDDAYVTFERYNLNREIFSRIQALRYRFMAQFGKDTASPFGRLKSIIDELFGAARQWVMLSEVDEHTFSHPERLQEHQARIEKFEKILWGIDEGDPISQRLEDTVQEMEQICRPQLDGKS